MQIVEPEVLIDRNAARWVEVSQSWRAATSRQLGRVFTEGLRH